MLELKINNPNTTGYTKGKIPGITAKPLWLESKVVSRHTHSFARRDVSSNDVYMFTRQFANLLKAGMEIPVALEILISQSDKPALRALLEDIYGQVNAGRSLADAMKKYTLLFGEMYINVIYSAQNGGELDRAMTYLSDLLERRNKLKSQVGRAMAYPCLMITVSIAVITFLLTAVIPNITAMFIETKTELPLVTSSLIFLSNMIRLTLPYAVITALAGYIALRYYLSSQSHRILWDKKKLTLPIFGKFMLEVETSKLCLSLCAMLKGGLNIVDALSLAGGILQNGYIRQSVEKISEGLNKGMSLEESFRKYGVFPPMIHHAIAIGESTGQLEKQLATMAEILDEEINRTTNMLTTMLEPVLMLVMGVVTGYIVAALILPIFEINNVL